jgi:4-amino-4-deoxy-L-arabinose transferase-like glycosyltransferase
VGRARGWRTVLTGDLGILILFALATVVVHSLANGQYGWHRDELATLDDARHLDWGFVAYPPLTPFLARIGLILFGPSLVGIRLFAALAVGIAIVLAGLIAGELGGSRRAKILAAVATASAPVAIAQASTFMYVAPDYLLWVACAYFVARLLNSGDPRWWLGVGAALGLGAMNKYTIAFLAAGIVAGVLLTPARRYLRSRWLWAGVGLAFLVCLPNLIWQAQHGFVSLEFLASIHARDVRIGRASGYLPEQLVFSASPLTIPLWIAGLLFYLFNPAGRRFRMLGWMYVVPFVLFLVTQGRSYYIGPAYPMLLAAGSVVAERWLATLSASRGRLVARSYWGALAVGGALFASVTLPIAPINSGLWYATVKIHDLFIEEVGWPDLTETVAGIYASLPAEERAGAGILTGNYGEAGALNLYGPAYGLPEAISGTNSYWPRGYGDPPPETLIVVGFSRDLANQFFARCDLAGQVTNEYGVKNEETTYHPDIFVCRVPRLPWPELWKKIGRAHV